MTKDTGLLIFRLGISFFMITYHGLVKAQVLFSGDEVEFFDPLGIGMMVSFILAFFAEFICSIFVALGLWTRLAAIPLALTMMVAFFVHHGTDPIVDRQMSGLFLLAYILLIFVGGGRFSIDRLFKKNRAY